MTPENQKRALLALLEARIAFRRHWIKSHAPKRQPCDNAGTAWEIEYDSINNFARIDAENVSAGTQNNAKSLKATPRRQISRKISWMLAA